MNAVATPAACTVATSRAVAAPPAPVQPDWSALLNALLCDMGDVTSTVAEIGDKLGPDEPAIGRLLDCALEDIYKVKRSLDARPLYVATTDAAYEALYKPLAHLQGAAAMARLMGVDIFSGAIESATNLLDEVHNNLGDQVIGLLLPRAPELDTTPAEAEVQEETESRGWLQVINDVISKQAVATSVLSEWVDHADAPAVYGVLTLMQDLGTKLDEEEEKGKADWDDLITGMFPRVSDALLIVADVARAVNRDLEDSTLYAVIYLLDYSKQIADGFIEADRAARTIPAGKIINV